MSSSCSCGFARTLFPLSNYCQRCCLTSSMHLLPSLDWGPLVPLPLCVAHPGLQSCLSGFHHLLWLLLLLPALNTHLRLPPCLKSPSDFPHGHQPGQGRPRPLLRPLLFIPPPPFRPPTLPSSSHPSSVPTAELAGTCVISPSPEPWEASDPTRHSQIKNRASWGLGFCAG